MLSEIPVYVNNSGRVVMDLYVIYFQKLIISYFKFTAVKLINI